jgi:hypothetical protein
MIPDGPYNGDVRKGGEVSALPYLLWGLGAGERRTAETQRTAQRPSPYYQNGELFFSEGISVSHLSSLRKEGGAAHA